MQFIPTLGADLKITSGIAIHKSASKEQGAVLKAQWIFMKNSIISGNTYLREGAIIGKKQQNRSRLWNKGKYSGKRFSHCPFQLHQKQYHWGNVTLRPER